MASMAKKLMVRKTLGVFRTFELFTRADVVEFGRCTGERRPAVATAYILCEQSFSTIGLAFNGLKPGPHGLHGEQRFAAEADRTTFRTVQTCHGADHLVAAQVAAQVAGQRWPWSPHHLPLSHSPGAERHGHARSGARVHHPHSGRAPQNDDAGPVPPSDSVLVAFR
jgi:hypothetical protein